MATYARPDQETTQVDDTMQLLSACLCIPADPLVSILELQGRCAEPQATEPAMCRANQVANLCADQGTPPSGVLLDHQLVPESDLSIGLHPNQLKRLDLAGC
jgi:hypothetical protein